MAFKLILAGWVLAVLLIVVGILATGALGWIIWAIGLITYLAVITWMVYDGWR